MAAVAGAFEWYRRSPGASGGSRPAVFWLGMVAFAAALVTPLDAASDHYLLSAHMLQHILITMVGPPLVLAGLPPLRPATLARIPHFLLDPWLAVTLFNADLLAWHWPAFYGATLTNGSLHVVEHLTFIGTALLFWWPITGRRLGGRGGLSPLMRIAYLAFAGVPPTVIGVTLAFVPALVYPFYAAAPRLFAGVGPGLDQEIAGILMFGLGNLIYFVPITRNFMRLLETEQPP